MASEINQSDDRKPSFQKVASLRHEPLHSLGVDCVGPVATLLEMGTDDHAVCLEVALQVVVGHSGAYEHRDSHRLGNLCRSKATVTTGLKYTHTKCRETPFKMGPP